MQNLEENISIGEKTIRTYYPPSYESATKRRYPLLLSLGKLTAAACAQIATGLHVEGILPEVIVAEISSTSGSLDLMTVVQELSQKVRLLDSPSARWLIGTGHQGVAVLEAIFDHPDFFGSAACLSTSFEGEEGAPPLHSQMLRRLEELSVLPSGVRLYFDYGTLGIDECYELYHRDLGSILRGKSSHSWRDGEEFQIVQNKGGSSSVESWHDRLGPALRWLAMR